MSRLRITDTSLRDAHQSLWATRMTTEDMIPILEQLDNIGYNSLEVWGGATFDVCLRYLNEDPWERLRIIRQHVKNTRLQMLLRGQSLLGYAHYPDDVVEKFVEKSAEYGIDIFRIFDALNDIRNLEAPINAVKKVGKHVQACVVYTISPVHTMEHFVETARQLKDMGADSICIKDMAGLLAPYQSYELVKLLKENLCLPVQLHTHYIGGLAVGACLKAAEAGVDVVDTASVPMAFGSSQPPVETIVRALQGTEWDTDLNLHGLFEIAEHFEEIRKRAGYERGVTRITDMKVFEHQVPGGMISNLVSQLEEQQAVHRLGEVLDEIPRVRKDLGYPPLVTPTSQIVGIQAVLNVLMGERYKLCPGEVKDYVRGFYGKSPVPIAPEVREKIIGDEDVITVRPADLIEPGWERAVQESRELAQNEEDILSYALFPQVAIKFFEYRKERGVPLYEPIKGRGESEAIEEPSARKASSPAVPRKIQRPVRRPANEGAEEVNIDEVRELILLFDETNLTEMEIQNQDFKLNLRKSSGARNSNQGSPLAADWSAGLEEESLPQDTPELHEDAMAVVSPMVGTFYRAPAPDAPPFVEVGDLVEAGQTLCIVEAMKLMNEIKSDIKGIIVEIMVENAQPVEYGQTMFLIAKE
ncbi:MAG: acetyl-CoA carboxylase biotin carboxyl carrier protein [Syntrophomonadaceae bacterium]|jgi:oxaloacetate decarboxylase alpha subunit|nr:acetyl-CoA carboxylase biotin carboxyl carrier protein [Syntrophomonadaceae bacterium]